MPRRVATEDDWDEDPDDWGGDDDEEYVPDDEDDDPTVACPHCQKAVHEQSEQCPHCGRYISEEDRPPDRKSWIVLGAVLCLIALGLWFLR